jgi:hypothetical protein
MLRHLSQQAVDMPHIRMCVEDRVLQIRCQLVSTRLTHDGSGHANGHRRNVRSSAPHRVAGGALLLASPTAGEGERLSQHSCGKDSAFLAQREWNNRAVSVMRRSRKRKHQLQRDRQRRYEARLHAGVLLCPVQLGPGELTTLVRLRWLPDGPVSARQAAAAIERLLQQL